MRILNFNLMMKSGQAIAIILLLYGCSGYKIENDQVYYEQWNEAQGKVKRKINADAKTLKVLEFPNYAKDKDHVFYQGETIRGADPGTFKPLSDFVGSDKYHGYYGDSVIAGSHGASFKIIDDYFTRDDQDVYYRFAPIGSCNPSSFVTLKIDKGLWAKDACSYYYSGSKVPIQDYKTFEILGDFGCGLAKDKYQVYNGDRIIHDVDPASFKLLKPCIGKDKFGCHNRYERCDCPG